MSYQIVTDSACNLTEETIDAFGLEILPLTFMVDGVQHRSYLKGEKPTCASSTMMREGRSSPPPFLTCKKPKPRCAACSMRATTCSTWGSRAHFQAPYEATELLMKQLAGEYPDRTLCAARKRSRHRAAKACSYIWPARKRKQAHRLKKLPISCAKRATTCATGLPSMI